MSVIEPAAFMKMISTEREKGYGFIPLIGAGVSVASGIPTGEPLRQYLAFCMTRALSTPRQTAVHTWNPRESEWPDFNDVEFRSRIDWVSVFTEGMKSGSQGEPTHSVMMEAVNAVTHWRTALMFLSRVQRINGHVVLSAPDRSVIDGFFLTMFAGARPNLAHRMWSMLADKLQSNIILTTNFDDLLESAFQEAGIPRTVFEVSPDYPVPSARLVRSRQSIVKLHGGRHGLRADDFFLDYQFSDEESRHIIEYLTGIPTNLEQRSEGKHVEAKNHLMVVGASGMDRRTIDLLRSALDRLPDLKVFVVSATVDHANAFVDRIGFPERVFLTVHQHIGLLLLELYQYLTGYEKRSDLPDWYRDALDLKDVLGADGEELSERIQQSTPEPLITVSFDDSNFTVDEIVLFLEYLSESYRAVGGVGLKIVHGESLIPSRETV